MAFDCLEVALEAVLVVTPLAERIAGHDPDLARQIRRAVVSIPSNIDEGVGNQGRRRVEHYRYALGSAREVATQLRIAHACGYVGDLGESLALLDRVRAMLYRLTH